MKTSKQCDCCKCMIEFEKSNILEEEIVEVQNYVEFGKKLERKPKIRYIKIITDIIICPICKNNIKIYEISRKEIKNG